MTDTGSREAAGTRSQGVVHMHSRHHPDASQLLAPALARPREGSGMAVLVVTPSVEDAVVLSSLRAATWREDAGLALTPLTSAARGERLVAADPPAVIASPTELVALLRRSMLRLENLRSVVLVWPEELLDDDRGAELEAVLAEVPRTADRIGIVARPGPALDAFLERTMWKARRISHVPEAAAEPTSVSFLAVGPEQRLQALRAVVDAVNPEVLGVMGTTEELAREADRAAIALGLDVREAADRLVKGDPAARVSLLVIVGVPGAEMLADMARVSDTIVVIVSPSEIPALRAASGGGARPFPTAGPIDAARSELDALRERVRAVIAAQGHLPWMAALEPLLTDLDPVEVAAGALALVHRARRMTPQEAPAAAARPATAAAPSAGPMTRIFLGIGERDGLRRNDLVGAITGEADINGSQVGKITMRDSHSVVEVDASVATKVIRKMNGATIKGRKVQVREDREPAGDRPPRSGPPRGAGPRGGAGPRSSSGPRGPGAPRGSRSFGDKPARGPRRDDDERPRGPRGPRRDDDERPRGPRRDDAERPRGRSREIDRMPRAAREGEEWAARGDRLRNARRRSPRDDG